MVKNLFLENMKIPPYQFSLFPPEFGNNKS